MTATPLSCAELARRLRLVEPAALLVPPRILRRVIKTHRGLGGLGLRVPHPHSYWIDRDGLLKIATAAELVGPNPTPQPPPLRGEGEPERSGSPPLLSGEGGPGGVGSDVLLLPRLD